MRKLFSIFSKKKIREKEKPLIVIDYREKNSMIPSELVSLGIEIQIKELKVADYIVQGVAIERKTVSDFITSMKNRRLLKQLEELQQYKDRLLIVEGIDEQELYTDSEKLTGMHPNAIRGFLLSILLKYKVPIIFTKNYEDTSKFLAVLSRKKPRETPLNISKKNMGNNERIQFIIESFPGIGPKTARKLFKKFKTIKNIINASEDELKDVIGKKSELLRKLSEFHFK